MAQQDMSKTTIEAYGHVPPPLIDPFPKMRDRGRTKVTPLLSGPICRHCVVTAAPVANHMQRLVTAVTVQPSRARARIGPYCSCIIDQTALLCIYPYNLTRGSHVQYSVVFVLSAGVQQNRESDYTLKGWRQS